uniref:F-box protein At5g18160-like n=1 Tax=Erigeron canadensis TaxID=72917 RepID=UPI001CB97C93|nr:F-box protein At5g18160-like [Erigeron canadensis]
MAGSSMPIEIQEEIIKRIPDVKSLVRFRSVSKAWKSVIDSPSFVNDHTRQCQHHPRHQLVTYGRWKSLVHDYIYSSAVVDDDDSFCQQEVMRPTILYPAPADGSIQRSSSSHGLVCVYPFIERCWETTATAVIWNPAITRKPISIDVTIPSSLPHYNKGVVGFGVCPRTLDPKLVKITRDDHDYTIPWQVEVYTLSSGIWRSINHNLPPRTLGFHFEHVVVDHGFIYWLSTYFDDEFQQELNMIMSFDVTTEEFVLVYLPDSLATYRLVDVVLSTRMDSLVVIEKPCYGVWKMEEHGVTRTFTKLFHIRTPAEETVLDRVHGFRNNGEPIIEVINHQLQNRGLYAYEPLLGRTIKFTGIDIDKEEELIKCVTSYTETLLLFDQ